MTDQYLRKFSLVVAGSGGIGIDLSALRIKFNIKQISRQTPNTLYARVYNLGPKIINQIEKEYTLVELKAGYTEKPGTIFKGTIVRIARGRENQTDTYLDIFASDSDAAYQYAFISKPLAPGSTPADQVGACLESLEKEGVVAGQIQDLGGNGLPRTKVMYGATKDKLRQLCESSVSSYFMTDGKLNIMLLTSHLEGPVIELNRYTGMIGLPEQTQDGIHVKCLINSEIKVGRVVEIKTDAINRVVKNFDPQPPTGIVQSPTEWTGFDYLPKIAEGEKGKYRVLVIEHSGDTRGQDWHSDIICLELSDGPSPGLIARLNS